MKTQTLIRFSWQLYRIIISLRLITRRVKNLPVKKSIALSLIFALLNLTVGCYYYKVKVVKSGYSNMKEIKDARRYIILHHEGRAWHFNNIQIKNNNIEGDLEPLPYNRMKYKTTSPRYSNRYKPKEKYVLDEAHLYLEDPEFNVTSYKSSNVSIPLTSIVRIELYDPDSGNTTASWDNTVTGCAIATAGIGIAAVIAAVIAAIVIVAILISDFSKGLCPFVYTYNSTGYNFTGEIYSGSIGPTLERHDYLPLPHADGSNNEYKIKITNELKEKQHTNLAELIIIDHPKQTRSLIDKYGTIHTLSDPQLPISCVSLSGQSVNQQLNKRDNCFYSGGENGEDQDFAHAQQEENIMDGIILEFIKPVKTDTGKLIINGKNSLWMEYVYGQFTELFGNRYNKWQESLKKGNAEKQRKWKVEQGIPILVYIETRYGWEFVDYINAIGPLASKDIVLPIDLSKSRSDTARIKLKYGFMFWDIDYAAMDFSANVPVEINYLAPKSATDQAGNDVSEFIENDDPLYLHQPNIGDEVVLTFDVPVLETGFERTIILHSKGYYEPIRDYSGKPNIKYLKSFKHPGALSKFSREKYHEACKDIGLGIVMK